jgi:hypothetical protein
MVSEADVTNHDEDAFKEQEVLYAALLSIWLGRGMVMDNGMT